MFFASVFSFDKQLNLDWPVILVNLPNCELIPRLNNIKKNMRAKKVVPEVKLAMASVIAMNVSPVPAET